MVRTNMFTHLTAVIALVFRGKLIFLLKRQRQIEKCLFCRNIEIQYIDIINLL